MSGENGYTFRLARADEAGSIISFMNTHWDVRHPLVNVPDFFNYYYDAGDGTLRFALAETQAGGRLAALAGFIPASQSANPDIWVSIWVADKSMRGSGLELMAVLPTLTGCRTLACNNIRPETMPFYNFLGYETGRVEQYYRLSSPAPPGGYKIARVRQVDILPVSGCAALRELSSPAALAEVLPAVLAATPPEEQNPAKDLWHLQRRYFTYNHFSSQHTYRLYAACGEDGAPFALFATRLTAWEGTNVLRIVDYIGRPAHLPKAGRALDALLQSTAVEYADFYCAGIPEDTMNAAGFTLRREHDENIIPNYLSPPLFENTDYYYFTSRSAGFTVFKADGDQDRPRL